MTLGGSNSDSVAQDQIRAFVERILRMRGEAKAINDDIREIYAEAKANGFDKTVLGKLVLYVEKREKNADALAERDALFDLYLEAFDSSPSRAHAHTRESAEYEPEASSPRKIDGPKLGAAEPVDSLSAVVADDLVGADPEKIYAEALNIVRGTGKAGASLLQRRLSISHSDACVLIDRMERDGIISEANLVGLRTVNGDFLAAPIALPASAGRPTSPAGAEGDEDRQPIRIPTAADNARSIRPWCLHADDLTKCGGYGRKHCHPCLKAHADEVGDAA